VEKKEFYKHTLPHFQQPGQAYFVTWCFKDAVPKKALERYTKQLEILQSQMRGIDSGTASGAAIFNHRNIKIAIANRDTREATPDSELENLRKQYYSLRKKYIKAFDDLLDAERNPKIDLSKPRNTEILVEALHFWEGKKLVNHVYSIMPNHVHWVFELKEKDEEGKPVYLQDVLQSVKRQTANQINKAEERSGTLWQKESFDTTIRDEKHLYYAIEYTLNNPVAAGLVKNRKDWPGTFGCGDF
jgi:putative transposase